MSKFNYKKFDHIKLIPSVWMENGTEYYVFNPTIVKFGTQITMLYRVVDLKTKSRRIAACMLDDKHDVILSTVTPVSDYIHFDPRYCPSDRSLSWFADPRYQIINNETYILWNNGSVKPSNQQYICKMSSDGLRPEGFAKPIMIGNKPMGIQKNWQIYTADEDCYAINTSHPLNILKVNDNFSNESIVCENFSNFEWDCPYQNKYGEVRGGAQPIRYLDGYLSLAHSSKKIDGKLIYYICFFRFKHGNIPFVTHQPINPLNVDLNVTEKRRLPPLNPNAFYVLYPCGVVENGTELIVSVGVNDEDCALIYCPIKEIESTMTEFQYQPFLGSVNDVKDTHNTVPLFWWNARGKIYDKESNSRFSIGNVGDIASKDFFEIISGIESRVALKGEPKLLMIGSILQNATNNDIVWGSGIKGGFETFKNPVTNLDVYSVRGPLSVDFLKKNGIDTSKLSCLFDPGCLLPYLYKDSIRSDVPKRSFTIVPHYKDDLLLRLKYPEFAGCFVSVDQSPLDFANSIAGSDFVITSSLHGIIFAESMGIPAVWLKPLNGEDTLKYYDYYYGTDRFDIISCDDVESAINSKKMPLPKFDFNSYINTFPVDAINKKFNVNCKAYSPVEFIDSSESSFISGLTFDIEQVDLSAFSIVQPLLLVKNGDFYRAMVLLLASVKSNCVTRDDVNNFSRHYLNCDNLYNILAHQNEFFDLLSEHDQVIHLFAELIDSSLNSAVLTHEIARVWDKLDPECMRYGACIKSILMSYIYSKRGDLKSEKQFINNANREDPKVFWEFIQKIYRHNYSATQIANILDI